MPRGIPTVYKFNDRELDDDECFCMFDPNASINDMMKISDTSKYEDFEGECPCIIENEKIKKKYFTRIRYLKNRKRKALGEPKIVGDKRGLRNRSVMPDKQTRPVILTETLEGIHPEFLNSTMKTTLEKSPSPLTRDTQIKIIK